jgi:hypothetical protein
MNTVTPDIELWDRATVLRFFGGVKPLHIGTLYRGIAVGRYPKPVAVAGNSVRWVGAECRKALQRMLDERDQRRPSRRGRPSARREAAL